MIDDGLRRVMAAWPALPEPIRRGVMALVDSVTDVTGTETSADSRENGGFGDGGGEGGR